MEKTEPAHSPFGPSSAERWLNCPASIRATAGMPDTDSDWSIEGTAAHALADKCAKLNEPASKYLGTKVSVKLATGEKTNVTVDQEMVAGVQEFLDYCNGFDGYHLNETRVYYTEYVPNGFGTTDRSVLALAIGRVVDLKFGKGVQVFAEDNEQLLCYALGIWLEWDWIYRFDKFILTIHQPRLDHVDSWEISVPDLLKWAEEVLVPGYKATLEENAKFNPGSWCKFCKIKASCRARAAKTFEVLQGEFENLNTLKPALPAELSTEELAQAYEHFANIKAWMTAVDEKLFSELSRGHTAGDLKIVNGRGARAWIGEDVEIAKQLLKAGVPKEALYEKPALQSVATLEKLIKNGKKRFGADGDLAKLVNKIPGKPTIARGDDRRKTLTPDIAAEFDNIGDE